MTPRRKPSRSRSALAQSLPLATRQKIAADHPELSRAVGIVPEASAPKGGKKARAKKEKPARYGQRFDSKEELRVFERLRANNPAVLCQVRHTMAPGKTWPDGSTDRPVTLQVDFVVVEEVLEDGTFIGRLVDAKARWKGGTGKVHEERDFNVKRRLLAEQLGLRVFIQTAEGEEG
jgi:hypothetical protein